MSARILLIPHDTAGFRHLAAALTTEYYDLVTVACSDEPIEWPKTCPVPDLIILDAMAADPDGFTLCRRIKSCSHLRHLPVLIVTTAADTEETRALNRGRGFEAGAEDYLVTPAHDRILFARIRSLVRLKRTLDEWKLREETTDLLMDRDGGDCGPAEDGGPAKILLVDNPTGHANEIYDALSADGNTVIVAPSCRTALIWASEIDCDVAIINISLIDDDPLLLCSQIRLALPSRQLPILLMIGDSDDQRLTKGLDLGVDDYLLRPFDSAQLVARTRTHVRRKRYQQWLRSNFSTNVRLALTDGLTGLYNRGYLDRHLATMVRRLPLDGAILSVLMIDIDHFKAVNDSHGHLAGDNVLRVVAQRILHHLRAADLAARYGGEEFVVIMPECPLDIALAIADRLCRTIAEAPVTCGNLLVTVTISIGVASTNGTSVNGETLLRAADDGLYRAKRSGRNRVVANTLLVKEHA
ncbi:MAG: diguanylate cyclase [Azospirillaceae bacterium]|nr:diguanylate cyclase [Azospirillaceae bacterium]